MGPKLRKILGKYCELGFYLFPIVKETKIPAIKNNLKIASIDTVQIEKWSDQFGDCNWGISLAKSGLVAIDVDRKHGAFESWAYLIELNGEPDTLKAISGSGGFHYLFKAKENARYRGQIQKNLDIKHNGYVVVYPSLHQKAQKRYRWSNWGTQIKDTPDWIADLIEKDERKGKSNPSYRFGNSYLKKLVDMLRDYDLTYHEWVQAGMAIHASEPNNEGLELYRRLTQGVSYQEGDIEKAEGKWEGFSSKESGISPLTLGFFIRQKGGTVPSPYYEDDKKVLLAARKDAHSREKDEHEGFYLKNSKMICWSRSDIIFEFNDRGYCYIVGGGNAPFARFKKKADGSHDLITMTEKGLKDLTAPYHFARTQEVGDQLKTVLTPAYREWVESPNRTTFKSITFKPKSEENELNLWGNISQLEPLKGEPKAVLDLIYESLCNGDDIKANWFLDWLAHIIQKPDQRSVIVPVLISKQGAGKGLLFDHVMRDILGSYYTVCSTAQQLTGRFNIALTRKFLTFIDEATWRGNKTEDGILKRLIGSPTMNVEEKYAASYEIENYSRYAIASNNKEAVSIEVGNRRYCLMTASESRANDLKFFTPIANIIQNENKFESRRFYNLLLERDLGEFNPYKILDLGEDGITTKLASVGPVAQFWGDLLYESPRRLWLKDRGLCGGTAYDEFISWSRSVGSYEKSLTSHKFWSVTKDVVKKLPERSRYRFDAKRIYVRDIDPDTFFRSFCETMRIPKAALALDPEEFYLVELLD